MFQVPFLYIKVDRLHSLVDDLLGTGQLASKLLLDMRRNHIEHLDVVLISGVKSDETDVKHRAALRIQRHVLFVEQHIGWPRVDVVHVIPVDILRGRGGARLLVRHRCYLGMIDRDRR